jgi:hypothetical protein
MRIGPEQVPSARVVLPLLFVFALVCNLFARVMVAGHDVGTALLGTSMVLAAWAMVLHLLMRFKGVPERFKQTFSALLGVDAVMTLLATLPMLIVNQRPVEPVVAGLLQALFMSFFVWDMLAKGAIYRQALNVGPMLGNLLAMTLSFAVLFLDSQLLPAISSSSPR